MSSTLSRQIAERAEAAKKNTTKAKKEETK